MERLWITFTGNTQDFALCWYVKPFQGYEEELTDHTLLKEYLIRWHIYNWSRTSIKNFFKFSSELSTLISFLLELPLFLIKSLAPCRV